MDQLGGIYESCPTDLVTDDLEAAIARERELTAVGQAGVVVRTADDAVLAPDGTWIVPVRKVG